MFCRSLRPLVLAFVCFAFLTFIGIVLSGAFAPRVLVTPLHAEELAKGDLTLVDPLPPGCIDGTPAGAEPPVCCISGFVYFEGREISGADVTIADAQGVIATVQTQVHAEGLERRPYYTFALSSLARPVTPTQEITLTVRYSGIEAPPVHHRVQRGGQRRDLMAFDPDLLVLAAQTQGEAEPGKFNLPYDVASDSQGNLYVIDLKNYRVQVFQPDGALLNRPRWDKGFGNLPDQFGEPSAIAIDQKTDTVYITDGRNRHVGVYTTDGDLKSIWDGENINDNIRWDYPTDVAVDQDGYVYVASRFNGPPSGRYRVYQFDGHGNFMAQVYGSAYSVGVAAGPNNEIYISDSGNHQIYKCTGISDCLPFPVTFPAELASSPAISSPASIDVDDAGNLYLRDLYLDNNASRPRVLQINSSGQVTPAWNYPQTDANFPQTPAGLTVYGDTIYVAGYISDQVVRLNRNGGYILPAWGGPAINHGQLYQPLGMAVAADDSLFVADYNARISRIANDVITQSWKFTETHGVGASWRPVDLVFDDQKRLLVVDLFNNELQRFAYNGDIVDTETLKLDHRWPVSGTDRDSRPSALDIDNNGHIYIVERAIDRLQVFSITANSLESIATFDGIGSPEGIAVDDRNPNEVLIYVADTVNHQIVKLKFNVAQHVISFFETWGKLGGDAVSCEGRNKDTIEFNYPQHVAIDSSGAVYVADSRNHRVLKFDNNGQCLRRYGSFGTAPGEMWEPKGLVIDNKGTLYVSDAGSGRIQRFKQMDPSPPVATIVHLSGANLAPGETVTAIGAGQDGDANNKINLYEWSTDAGVLQTTTSENVTLETSAFITEPGKLGPGTHKLRLRVQEQGDEEEWSDYSTPIEITVARLYPSAPPPTQTVPPALTCPTGQTWTFLLYLAADYNDQDSLYQAFEEARQKLLLVANPCVQFGVQLDGPASISNRAVLDTQRWIVRSGQAAEWKGSFEAAVDNPLALADFLAWGQQYLTADHYYVAIANHGNALQGIAWDHTSDATGASFLTTQEIRDALADPNLSRIDILHLDACSMGLLDIGYQLRDKVDYLITSQNIGWGFFAYNAYAEQAVPNTTPAQLAQQIIEQYATQVEDYQQTHGQELPYTLAAWNLARVEPVMNGVDALAVLLKAWVRNDDANLDRHKLLVNNIRNNSLLFNSDGNLRVTLHDEFIDLRSLLTQLVNETENDEIITAANNLLTELQRSDGLILHSHAAGMLPPYYEGGQLVNLGSASGVSVYFPVQGDLRLTLPPAPDVDAAGIATSTTVSYTQLYAQYISGALFDLPRASRWDEFLVAAYGTPPANVTLEPPPAPLPPQVLPAQTPTPIPEPEVEVEQTYTPVGNGPVTSSAKLLFQTTIINHSDIALTNLVLYQALPDHLRIVNDVVIHAANVDGQTLLTLSETQTTTVALLIGDLPGQEQRLVTFEMEVVANAPADPFAGLFFQLAADQLALTAPKAPQVQYELYLPLVNR